jgi:hypothetical protein
MNSKVVSISSISAGLIAIALLVGAYFEFADLFAVVIASVFVLMPLYLKSYKGSVLAGLAGGVIAFLCSGLNFLSLVFPTFISFFCFYPIVKCKMVEKSVKKIYNYIFGLVWFLIVAYGAYFYYTLVMHGVFEGLPNWISDYILYFIGALSIVFYFIYDRFIFVVKLFLDKYLSKIIK